LADSTTFSTTTLITNSDPVELGRRTLSSNHYFNGSLDEARIYSTPLSADQIATVIAETHPCAESVDAFGFNCIESGGDALAGKLYTKMVNQSFSLDIAALKDSDDNDIADAVELDYASDEDRTVTVEIIDTSSAAACADYPTLNPAITRSLVFTSTDNGRKISAPQSISKAYASLACRVIDSGGASPVTGCSTDSFSVRPTELTLGIPTLTNSGSSGSPVAVAGSNFTLTADADAGYTGTPKLDTNQLEAHNNAVRSGTLSGTFGAALSASGTATGTAFSYSEVGNFRFLSQGIYDASFTTVDQPSDCTDDFSNTPVAGKV